MLYASTAVTASGCRGFEKFGDADAGVFLGLRGGFFFLALVGLGTGGWAGAVSGFGGRGGVRNHEDGGPGGEFAATERRRWGYSHSADGEVCEGEVLG